MARRTLARPAWLQALAGALIFSVLGGSLAGAATAVRFPAADWEAVAPEAEGVDSAGLRAAVAHMDATFGPDGARELVIVRHGRLIWAGPGADAYHTIYSCTKTFTSTVLGLLVEDGKCALDDPAVKFLPELDDQYPLYGKIELRHLASMCGGYRGEVTDKRPDQPREGFFAKLAAAIAPAPAGSAARRTGVDTRAPAARPATLPPSTPTVAAPDIGTPARRVGDWEITRWAGLDVVGDPGNGTVHLVFRDENRLYYSRGDEGGNWSPPELVVASGMHPRLALDRTGTLHLVYCSARAKDKGDRLPDDGYYTSRRDGRWSTPVRLNEPEEGAIDVRVAVDGRDNVHVLYWAGGSPNRELGNHERHRCYYRRKPAASGAFEPALCFANSVAPGPSSHGTLAVGLRGEVHVLYRTFQTAPTWAGNLEHRIREPDGAWRGEPAVHRGFYWTDHSLSAWVDARGALYVAGYTFRPHGFRFMCYRQEAGGGELEEIFSDAETYGTSSGIVGTPAGDLWLTGSGNWSLRSRSGKPRSNWYRYAAATKTWSKQFLSPEEKVNVDIFCEGPRLLSLRGLVHVFYAEKGADGKFRLYQKILTPAPGILTTMSAGAGKPPTLPP